jgi:hypothetical protein
MSNIFLFGLILVVVFLTYHLSAFPSLAGGDSGELLSESCQLGIAHPPGSYISYIVTFYNYFSVNNIHLGVYTAIHRVSTISIDVACGGKDSGPAHYSTSQLLHLLLLLASKHAVRVRVGERHYGCF